ncbi:MAG: hypothetical protein M1829_004672 [Trizodia sp. TS-e1964]|nr:MAG: hypothetical protein M1829_004672 [Trizodia sp. TS-e1964]
MAKEDNEERRDLLSSGSSDGGESDNLVVHEQLPQNPHLHRSSPPPYHNRGEAPTPRSTTRVRFQIDDEQSSTGPSDRHWTDEEDFLTSTHGSIPLSSRRERESHRAPLLTDIEAPSVTVASADLGFHAEELLESARPKSGMRMAFMNMANSIIGAGIIGRLDHPIDSGKLEA